MAAKALTLDIKVAGAKALKRALKVLGETDAPFLREALEQSGKLLRAATAKRAPGSIAAAVAFAGVKGTGGALRAPLKIKHPGAIPMEFGRVHYYRGFTGRRQKATGQRFKASPGQKAKPFLGVVSGGGAIAEVRDEVEKLIRVAFEREWERIASEGDVD